MVITLFIVASRNNFSLKQMDLNLFTLSFSKKNQKLERIFIAEYRDKVSNDAIWSLSAGLFFYAVFAFLDYVLAPEIVYTLWFIRFAIVCPVLAVFILSSFFSFFKKVAHLYLIIALILSGTGISVMVALAPPLASSSYYAGVILVLMMGYGLTRLRFIWASLAGWINIIVYEIIAITVVHTSLPILINNNFFFISANVIGMGSCYALEFFTRRDFYLSRLLTAEQTKVKRFNRDLEKKVHERTTEITKINESLQQEIQYKIESEKQKEILQEQLAQAQKMESIGQLAGGIAHDFNNQLTGILGNAELLSFSLTDPKLKNFAENICKGALNGAQLTQQLLSFARKGEFKQEIIALEELILQVIGILKHTIDRSIEVTLEESSEKMTVLGDSHQIQNALLNIALNARDAIVDKGTISFDQSILIIEENHPDHLFNLSPGKYVCIGISDDGMGMTEEVKQHLFEPFYTTKEVGKGTGMGLSASYGAIKQQKGGIFIESVLGVGTSFYVLLPFVENSGVIQEETKDVVGAEKRAAILIVDDDEVIRNLSSEFLEMLGYSLHGVPDGETGLDYYREHLKDIDLVIIDLIMPKKGGEALCFELKEVNPQVNILLISGNGPDDERIARLVQQDIPFIQKPFLLSGLSEIVDKILSKS